MASHPIRVFVLLTLGLAAAGLLVPALVLAEDPDAVASTPTEGSDDEFLPLSITPWRWEFDEPVTPYWESPDDESLPVSITPWAVDSGNDTPPDDLPLFFAPIPGVSLLDVPTEVLIGENFHFKVVFTSAAQVGYGPFIQLYLDFGGKDRNGRYPPIAGTCRSATASASCERMSCSRIRRPSRSPILPVHPRRRHPSCTTSAPGFPSRAARRTCVWPRPARFPRASSAPRTPSPLS